MAAVTPENLPQPAAVRSEVDQGKLDDEPNPAGELKPANVYINCGRNGTNGRVLRYMATDHPACRTHTHFTVSG